MCSRRKPLADENKGSTRVIGWVTAPMVESARPGGVVDGIDKFLPNTNSTHGGLIQPMYGDLA